MDEPEQTRHVEFRLPAKPRSAQAARRLVRETVVGLVDKATAQDVELLLTELVTNSVRHGARASSSEIEIDVSVERTTVTVEVEDKGPGFDIEALPGPGPYGEGGWGLMVVSRVAKRWGTRRTPGGFSVWFTVDRADAA